MTTDETLQPETTTHEQEIGTAEDRALNLLAAHGDGPPERIAERFAGAVRETAAGKSDDLVVLTLEFI